MLDAWQAEGFRPPPTPPLPNRGQLIENSPSLARPMGQGTFIIAYQVPD